MKTPSLRNFEESPDKHEDGPKRKKTMVGLKTFWILISTLFVLMACVPQVKQSECGTNEAFNASLRTCVPVIGGPSSFINIASYNPQFSSTRYQDDQTNLDFTITVSNPYNQSYTVEWERVFNAAPVSMCSNSLTCELSAYYLGTTLGQVGTHIITAKIKDANGTLVDSHNFELKVNDQPLPTINSATIMPQEYALERYPDDADVEFYFTIKNNGATIEASDGYQTTWTVIKNGAVISSETLVDPFSNFLPTSLNTTYFRNATAPFAPKFNPNGALYGVGSYIVRAVVSNATPGEVVDEHQWNIIVRQPDLANVTNINSPSSGITINAHNGIDYDDYPTRSWTYGDPATQPNFCVEIDDRDGTYSTDTLAIQVRFYLDGLGGDICTKTTLHTPGTQTICLLDADPCKGSLTPSNVSVPPLLKFSNSSPTVTQNHKVTARLFDEATTFEFQRSDVIPSNGSYPIEWNVNVSPVNTAPVMAFGTLNPASCESSGTYTKSNCAVDQSGTENFNVSFSVTDDFYSPLTHPGEFQWDVKLKRSGSDIVSSPTNTQCSKAFGTAATLPAASGPYITQWVCNIAVPHFIATGPLDPSSGTYQVVASMQDSGSPIGGSGMVSSSLTWNLVVTEKNPSGIAVSPQTALVADSHVASGAIILDPANIASFATENDTITFRMNVTDAELDNFKYQVFLCTAGGALCTTSNPLMSYTDFLRVFQLDPDLNPQLVSALLYKIPEDLLLQITPQSDILVGATADVYFKVQAVDVPSIGTTSATPDFKIFKVNIANYNPPPSINTATASPAVGSTTVVYSGVPFTIDPGAATDASTVSSENTIVYQWFASNGGAFTAITGATSRVLKYTPGNTTSPITLRVCAGDRSPANPATTSGACFGDWTVTPKKYLYDLTGTGMNGLGDELAVWFDDTNTVVNTQVIYSAYVDKNPDNSRDIYVEKTIKNTSGDIVLTTETIRFPALSSGSSTNVQNLSISGSAESIYVAYIASASSAPSTFIPRIRRIEKTKSNSGSKSALSHSERFGFNYVQYTLTESSTNVTVTNGNGTGGPAMVSFIGSGLMTVGETISINGVTFTSVATNPISGSLEMCSATCANGNDSAALLASQINSSTNSLLHGISARTSGSDVLIYGQYGLDYLDFDGATSGIPGLTALSNGMGKIFVSYGRWHLPFVNSSLGGNEQNNITVLSGVSSLVAGDPVHLRDTTRLDLSTNDVLTDIGKVAVFDAKLNAAGQLVIAAVSGEVSNAGAISLYRYALTGNDWNIFDVTGGSATDQNEQAIFGAYAFQYVKLATDATSNNYYYVLAKETTLGGSEFHMGRYNKDLDSAAAVSENIVTTRLSTTDSTSSVITDVKMKNPDIVSIPGSAEARILFHSVGSETVPYPHPRIARWKSDDTISCGSCLSLNGALEYQSTAKIGLSQVANDISLGASGSVTNEHINDLVFVMFSSDIAVNDVFKPQLGIVNTEAEAIQSTTTDSGGLFAAPFVK